MTLGDAELQQTTGSLIAKGHVRIGSETDMGVLGIATHNHVLLSSEPRRTTIWPVIRTARDEFGFCDATLCGAGLTFWSLSLDDIGELSRPKAGRCSQMRGRSELGNLMRGRYVETHAADGVKQRRWSAQRAGPIHDYELSTEYGSEGLNIAISGHVAVAADESNKPFSIDATVPWPTLTLKGIRSSVAYWKFGHPQGLPSKTDFPSRPRDSRKLGDLLLSQGLTWPYVRGQISFTPEPDWPAPRQSAHDFVSIHFEDDQIGFWDARKLEVLDTGFTRSNALHRHITMTMFDRGKLEKALQLKDAFSIKLAGDALGSVRYQTGYEDPRDRLGWINQTIRTMSLHLLLGTDGLRISANGELNDFDPVEFGPHRERRNSQLKPVLKPLHTYSVDATMPWALLVARGFALAQRAKDF